jgi:hypothetical protein
VKRRKKDLVGRPNILLHEKAVKKKSGLFHLLKEKIRHTKSYPHFVNRIYGGFTFVHI